MTESSNEPFDALSSEFLSVFDESFYINRYGIQDGNIHVPTHYIAEGEAKGNKPNFVFDPTWYKATYNIAPDLNALEDYISFGEKAGRKPSLLFDTPWFSERYANELAGKSPLAFYLKDRHRLMLSPTPYFDLNFYFANNPDVAAAGVDGYEHYVNWGIFEGRQASPNFDAEYIWKKYLNNNRKINPYLAFLRYGEELEWTPLLQPGQTSIANEIRHNLSPNLAFEPKQDIRNGMKRVKALAFYLPQFHPFAENDAWWGTGFTEWTNISRGVPRFVGHVQPRVPRDLGFYNLLDRNVIRQQVNLALNMGLHGFCFYYYNFDGKRLLEKPLDLFVSENKENFPFCIMWANENWTRRWDGMESDILIAQTYKEKDENALIADMARYLSCHSYLKVQGRPLLLIYRADIIPECPKTLQRWRDKFDSDHNLKPLLVMAQTFGNSDPRIHGFDAAVEFPPHKFGSKIRRINHDLEVLDEHFRGDVRSYDELVEQSVEDFPKEYSLIKTIVPSWDNDARKQGNGMTIHGSTPAKFEEWASRLVNGIERHPVFGEKLLFVNAWNEWCEGAYLEPDIHYGFAYGNALAKSITTGSCLEKTKILLVGHDAFPAGAQQLLLSIGTEMLHRFGLEVAFILMGGGSLVKEYSKVGSTYVFDSASNNWEELNKHLFELYRQGYKHAITNSAFSGHSLDSLSQVGIETISLIHELPRILKQGSGEGRLKKILDLSNKVIFPNKYVKKSLESIFGPAQNESYIRAQGLYKHLEKADSSQIKKKLGLRKEDRVVLNVGYADLRKGVDIFVSIAGLTRQKRPHIHFVWVGARDPGIDAWLTTGLPNVHFIEFTSDVSAYFYTADVFLLTSREDPFPSVVLEALYAGIPVMAFSETGGAPEILQDSRLGRTAEMGDLHGAASEILDLIDSEDRRHETGSRDDEYRTKFIADKYNFADYCADLLKYSIGIPKVSVIVPNYNYARYMRTRLGSIFSQTFPIFEIIILDDASSDNSIESIENLAHEYRRDFVLIENDENSGNVFKQWRKGLETARGDLVWIAEADDLSEPQFLASLVAEMQRQDCVLAFSDSKAIDADGQIIYENYKGYYETLFPGQFTVNRHFDARDFAEEYLSVNNIILNASSVLWRRAALESAFATFEGDLMDELKLAGDWKAYINACLTGGTVAYISTPLNIHRRHKQSVTGSIDNERHLTEIAAVHRYIRRIYTQEKVRRRQNEYLATLRDQFSAAN